MNLHHRLRRLEHQAQLRPPDPMPEVIRVLLPGLAHLDPEQRQRVLVKEWNRIELRMGFAGHVIPGVFTLDLTPEEIERAVQAMLDAAYPNTPAPRDVAPGDIEEVVRRKRDASKRDLYERRQYHRVDTTPGTFALLEPETGDMLKEAAQCYSFGTDWNVTVPWVDLGGASERERPRGRGRRS